ncbi:MAG: hypothetical protein AAF804_13920 [Bacteroidota bacterium]
MDDLTFACPHCRRETPIHLQRCQQCGLLMMSDQEYALLSQHYLPLLRELREVPKSINWKKISEYQNQWAQLKRWGERLPWMSSFQDEAHKAWLPLFQQYHQYRRTLQFHWMILAFFVLVALVGTAYTRDLSLGLLLLLPVGGWYWLGIRRLK